MINVGASPSEVKKFPSSETSRSLHLLIELTRRDFKGRFTGSALGIAWAVLQPLTFVALYWFVFTTMFTVASDAGSINYPLFLISGLLPWLGFQEGIMRGHPRHRRQRRHGPEADLPERGSGDGART